MQDQPFLDRLMNDISRHLPADLGRLRQEVEHSVRAVLNETMTRLDLISREEFEIQQQVLERTRAKLEALEKQVAELEGDAAPAAAGRGAPDQG
ncbi:accessory factor UbiK family protein [Alloalcanivorax mobilis]|uniref:accessory factor UbiK family protein n=1 Tax=Alloalcanivorax mobilis TaxID=2019569 RepID=UPI000B5B348D|nr:accessory factor UbiK family protein [Alloalcanivorax mobilis]ASK35599.1 hypothetical protein CEK62_15030 [Alcanivorax sp. N3-2A]|tara:strand:+ start:1556 stop:1837 length:282 start_codon:yes stop_codon:yes gene_type:complete